jgi:hypothetical protein
VVRLEVGRSVSVEERGEVRGRVARRPAMPEMMFCVG